jgi:hypothetical protein
MAPSRTRVLTAVLLITGSCVLAGGPAYSAQPKAPRVNEVDVPLTFALIGDTPYGDEQRTQFPALLDEINDDPRVNMVLHAGDIKNGSSTCDDARFRDLYDLYETFRDPFVLTPGDNEWTDCHRVAAGRYLPTERLVALRDLFYAQPTRTLGVREMPVVSQGTDGTQSEHQEYVENVRFARAGVVFATAHIVGSENDLAPWTDLAGGDRPEERLAEFAARRAANLDWIGRTFDRAEAQDAAGVLLMMQAEPVQSPGFAAERELIVERAAEFGRPVLLVHGDEHVFEVERQYAGVPNLTRLETFGDTAMNWLRVTVDPSTEDVFDWSPRTVGDGS